MLECVNVKDIKQTCVAYKDSCYCVIHYGVYYINDNSMWNQYKLPPCNIEILTSMQITSLQYRNPNIDLSLLCDLVSNEFCIRYTSGRSRDTGGYSIHLIEVLVDICIWIENDFFMEFDHVEI